MIAVCNKCRKLFETSAEDAYTPGVLCSTCYKANSIEVRMGDLEKVIGTYAARSLFRGGSELEMDRCNDAAEVYFEAKAEWLRLSALLAQLAEAQP